MQDEDIIIAAGTKQVISVSGPKPEILVVPWPNSGFTTAACGHQQAQWISLTIVGKPGPKSERPVFEDQFLDGHWDTPCMVCGLAEAFKMIATCAFCGCPILPGQGVGVFAADLTVEQSARAFRDEHGQAMSCTSQDCLPSGGFYAGTWNGTGINSPFAHGNSAMEAFMTGKPVVSSTQR